MTSIDKKIIKKNCPIKKLGIGNKHHFFGYYNKTPWHKSLPFVLANQHDEMDADLTPDLVAQIGYFNLEKNEEFVALDETTTWNWQMGCQLQWLDALDEKKVIFNIRSPKTNNREYPPFASKILNIETGEEKVFDYPVYTVAPNSKYAITVDYRRLYVTHETIGYSEPLGKAEDLELYPENDGLIYLDLQSGTTKLLVSYADLRNLNHSPSMDKAIHWISHIEINPNSSRILFLHRWTERVEDETCFLHRLVTINPDGTGIRILEDSDHPLPQLNEDFDPSSVGTYDYEKSEYQISHPLWKNNDSIIVWAPHKGSIHYHLYEDKENGIVEIIGEDLLTENGHMSYSPVNDRWLLTDTYPDSETSKRKLLIYDTEKDLLYEIGEFYTPDLKKESRCDLHPRWDRSGNYVCIDSVHEKNQRQMYVIDVRDIVEQ